MIHTKKSSFAAAAVIVFSAVAPAQSFNIDVGSNVQAPLPSSSYGAAAGQPGVWTACSSTSMGAVALQDVNGASTGVQATPVGGLGDFFYPSQPWTGDDAALLKDAGDVSNPPSGGGNITWTFTGLTAGSYTIYTYAIAPDDPLTNFTSVNVSGSPEGSQNVGGTAWAGGTFVQGVTHARHTMTLTAGQSLVVVTSNSGALPTQNFGTCNGFQIVKTPVTPPLGTFCAGDGSGTPCPCGNNSAAGNDEGCASSLGLGGKLVGSGNASVSADTFVLVGSQMPNSTVLYFQGTAVIAGGQVFGDGLRCAGGSVIRLGTQMNGGGASQYPSLSDPSVSVKGIDAPGDARTYQAWYRNSASFCTSSTFNLTNGWQITWAP